RTYSITSPRRSKQKSTSMSGMDIRSGFRNRSNSRSNRSGSTLVMPSEYATSAAGAHGDPALACRRDEVLYNQEVTRVSRLVDHPELVGQPLLDRLGQG